MELSKDTIFTLDHSYPEMATILPIVNEMSRNGYSVKANFRHSHSVNQYYLRLNIYPQGALYPLLALRFFLKKDFKPNDAVYEDFCDANYDDYSLFFSTNNNCSELLVSSHDKDKLPEDIILTPKIITPTTNQIAVYAIPFVQVWDDFLSLSMLVPILNEILNRDGGIVTLQTVFHGNNGNPRLRLYFDYKGNPLPKSPIRLSITLYELNSFYPKIISNLVLYSQQSYPIQLEIKTDEIKTNDKNVKNDENGENDKNDKNSENGKNDENDKNSENGKNDENDKNGKNDKNDKNSENGKNDKNGENSENVKNVKKFKTLLKFKVFEKK